MGQNGQIPHQSNKYSRGSKAGVWSERTLEARGNGVLLLEMYVEGLEGIELSGPPRSGHRAVEKCGEDLMEKSWKDPGLARSPSDSHASFIRLTPPDSSVRSNISSSEMGQTIIFLVIFD